MHDCVYEYYHVLCIIFFQFVHAYLVHKKVMSRNHTHTKKKLLVLTSEKTQLEKELAEVSQGLYYC